MLGVKSIMPFSGQGLYVTAPFFSMVISLPLTWLTQYVPSGLVTMLVPLPNIVVATLVSQLKIAVA